MNYEEYGDESIKDRYLVLKKYLKDAEYDFDDDEIDITDEKRYIFSLGDEGEFRVLTLSEADDAVEDYIKDIIDEMGLEAFSDIMKEQITQRREFLTSTSYFDNFVKDSTRKYIESIDKEEVLDLAEDYDIDLSQDISVIRDELIFPLVQKANKDYDDSVDWYLANFGEESFYETLKTQHLLNFEKITEECIMSDGRGHFLASYDGKEHIITSDDDFDYYIYRLN